MPVYNSEKFLREAIESILNQTFKDFEFLIINDPSTDTSRKIILSYKDLRIRFYENKKHIGLIRTLNKGLSLFYQLQFRNCLGHSTVIFNKEIIINEFGGYDERCEIEDYDLWLRLSKKYKIVKLDKILMKIRCSKQSKTMLFRKALNENTIIIAQKNLQSLIRKPISAEIVTILVDLNLLGYSSPQKIKEALSILEEINIGILDQCPLFLNKSIIKRCSKSKKNWMRFYLLITIIFKLKFLKIIMTIYRLYRLIKYSG